MSGGRRAQSAVASVTTADRRARFGAPSSSSSTGSTLDALDWFDRYSLVSKQLGADADNNPRHSLKVRSVQEEFYAKILEEEAKMGRTEKVVAAFRKLREGVTSSNIHDEFAIKVYEHSVDVCLDVDDSTGELIKSLAQLIGTIYPGAEAHIPETNPDKNHSLTRRSEMSKLYLLYVISTPPTQVPTEPRRPSTAPPSRPQSARDPQLPRRPLHGDINEIMKIYRALPTHIRETEDVQFAMDIFWVLRSDLDYVRFGMLWRKMGTREKTIMKDLLPRVRQRTFQILCSSFYAYPLAGVRQLLLFGVDGSRRKSGPVNHDDEETNFVAWARKSVLAGTGGEWPETDSVWHDEALDKELVVKFRKLPGRRA